MENELCKDCSHFCPYSESSRYGTCDNDDTDGVDGQQYPCCDFDRREEPPCAQC